MSSIEGSQHSGTGKRLQLLAENPVDLGNQKKIAVD